MSDRTRALVREASQGDVQAVERLLADHLPAVQRFLRHRAPALVLQKESSVDLVQSVCREALQRLRDEAFEYRGEAEFRQWLYRAAELKLQNRVRFYRADKRDVGRDAGAAARASEQLLQTLRGPSGDLVKQEDLERFQAAFERLSTEHRRIITLAYLEQVPHKDIAVQLGITPAHSRKMLSRALAQLSKYTGS